MEHVAMELGMDTESLRRKNLYEQGQVWEERTTLVGSAFLIKC